MDDARIQKLTEEVLAALQSAPAGSPPAGLEARVAALEAAVSRLRPGPAAPAAPIAPPAVVHVHAHPALQVLPNVSAGGDRCVLEPDKPCVQSGACRSFGH